MSDTSRVIPNLFIVGAMKAGSTSLYELLAASADVWMCPVKEPNHFCSELYEHPDFVRLHTVYPYSKKAWIADRGQYLRLFGERRERYVGEASPTYLNSAAAAGEIRRFNPNAKILITLRNPVERAYSEYEMNRVIGIAAASFSSAVGQDLKRYREGRWSPFERYITASCYFLQVKRYFDLFPREQISVHVMDRPKRGFQALADEVESFLEIKLTPAAHLLEGGANIGARPMFPALNQLFYKTGIKRQLSKRLPEPAKKLAKNYYYGPKAASGISDTDRALLWSVFRPDVDNLSALIQQDLSHWQ